MKLNLMIKAVTEITKKFLMCKQSFLGCPGVKLLTESVHAEVFFHQ